MDNSTANEIRIPFPEASDLHLRISVGACRLRVTPGGDDLWVAGTYTDPTGAMPLRVEQEGNTARISQAPTWPEKWNTIDRPPAFDLVLGRAHPYALSLETGANEGTLDLGGLPLTRLVIKHGAGKQDINFSAPNPQPMQSLTVSAGAAALEIANLANANLAELVVEGGAAGYVFDFGGILQRSADVRIATGMASTEIRVPAGTAARVTAESVMGSVDVGDGFMKKEGAFWNEAALAGKTPLLTMRASVAMGSIRLRSL